MGRFETSRARVRRTQRGLVLRKKGGSKPSESKEEKQPAMKEQSALYIAHQGEYRVRCLLRVDLTREARTSEEKLGPKTFVGGYDDELKL